MSNVLSPERFLSLPANGLSAIRVAGIFESKPVKLCCAILKPHHGSLEKGAAGDFYQSRSFIWKIRLLYFGPAQRLLIKVEIGEPPKNMRRPSRTVRFIAELYSFGYSSDVW
jgi:hypothetical protein